MVPIHSFKSYSCLNKDKKHARSCPWHSHSRSITEGDSQSLQHEEVDIGVDPPVTKVPCCSGRSSRSRAWAVSWYAMELNSFSTLSASLADVSKNLISYRSANSFPTCVGISRLSAWSILLPKWKKKRKKIIKDK